MAATGKLFPTFFDSLAQKKIDLDSDTLKVMLLSSYTYSDAHQYLSDIKAAGSEAAGTGYTAGGATITGITWTRSGAVFTLDGADVSWNTAGGTLAAAHAVIYDATPGTDATRPVIGYINLDGAGGNLTSSNGVFSIVWNAAGVVTLTAA